MKLLSQLILLSVVWSGSGFTALGQLAAPALAADTPAASGKAWVRAWAVLGTPTDSARYNLSYKEAQTGASGHILESIRGSFRTGFGPGYTDLPAGKYLFVLHEEGKSLESGAHVIAELAPDSGQTLVAYLAEGKPQLLLAVEHPVAAGQDGVYIYNLLSEPSLELTIDEGSPTLVPPISRGGTPVRLAPGPKGASVRLSFLNHRQSRVSTPLSWKPGVRTSAVFLRSNSGRPSVLVLSSVPSELSDLSE